MRRAWNGLPLFALLLCAACATSPSARPQPSTASLPPVPEDPLALVVEEVETVAVVNVQALTSSPLFERLRPYIERATCIQLAHWNALLSATKRAALAARNKPDQAPEWLLVLAGRYTDADARRLLTFAHQQAGGAAAEPTHDTRDGSGRFGVSAQGALAVSQLEGRVLVLGTQAWQRAAVTSISQPMTSFLDSGLWRDLGPQLGCAERTACLVSVANSTNARQIERSLAGAGAKQLGRELQSADSTLGLTMRDGLGLGFAAQLGSNEAAQAAERALRDWLWQANLVVRLTGLPAVLDRTRLSTQATLVRAELELTQAELDAYEARAKPLFDRQAPSCSRDAQSL